ncbi:uncharacterized protein [Ptychodera flava]|uniref:uncharacterized protein n=1 Tax=Ptychodera flava TaxID=63121 RepID=UPI00396AA9C1
MMWRVIISTLLIFGVIGQAFGVAPMVGVDCKNKLVTRRTMLGKWTKIGGSCCINNIGFLKDGRLIGVADDNQLYVKKSPNVGDWEGPLPDSCCVKDVAVMPDGSILGVNMEGRLVKRPIPRTTSDSGWVVVPNSLGVAAVDVYRDGRIVGVSKTGKLRIRENLESPWKYYKCDGLNVRDIAIQRNGILFGIGKKSKSLHVLDSEGVWGAAIPDTDCLLSIVSVSNLVD